MIEYRQGDIFDSGAEVLVNPVNTKGVAGKGLALEFKKRFKENYDSYHDFCQTGFMNPGEIHMYCVTYEPITYIANLSTKDDWRDPSQLYYVRDGLIALYGWLQRFQIKSVAIPALGCGLGGLHWKDVKPLIEKIFDNTDIHVIVYEPFEEPA